jgi:hypothetical protein
VAIRRGLGAQAVRLDEVRRSGVYVISVDAPEGRVVRKIVRE